MFPNRHAGGHGKRRDALSDQVCIKLCVGPRKGKNWGVERRAWQISLRGAQLFRHQGGGWSSMMMNHDGSAQGPAAAWGCSHYGWVKGGGIGPRLQVDTEPRWRGDTWGICLFISSHMLYPLQRYSESAQWGIRWMLHQLSEDGWAFLPQEPLTQTCSIVSGALEGFGCDLKCFWHFTLSQWTSLALLTHHPVLSPQCRAEIK